MGRNATNKMFAVPMILYRFTARVSFTVTLVCNVMKRNSVRMGAGYQTLFLGSRSTSNTILMVYNKIKTQDRAYFKHQGNVTTPSLFLLISY